MSTPDTPAVEDTPSLARLPDELVLLIVDWCDKLVKDRLETLAALALLGKRFKSDVERHLYSRVALSDEPTTRLTAPGTVREVLHRRPSLRRLVRAVELGSARIRPWVAGDDRVAQVLEDLPAVSDIICWWNSARLAKYILSNHAVQVRRLEAYDDPVSILFLINARPAAFATLQSLRSRSSGLVHGLTRFGLEHHGIGYGIKTLELVELDVDLDLGELTAPFANILTRLSLPVSARLAASEPAMYPSLQYLSLSSEDVNLDAVREATSSVVTFLLAAARSASLVSFEWQCTIAPSEGGDPDDNVDAMPVAPSPVTKAILAAIPRQIRHLSLLTNCFALANVADYLLDDAQRPSQLATLRIGGALGRGLARILVGEVEVEVAGADGPCVALADVLERAGIEVTTVG